MIRIQSFSNAHELLEIATGDAATFNLTEEQLREKHRREQEAKEQLLKRLTPELGQNLEEHERQDTPEARFVRAVDKILPVAMDVVGQGVRVIEEDYDISTLEDLKKAHANLIANFDRRLAKNSQNLSSYIPIWHENLRINTKKRKQKSPRLNCRNVQINWSKLSVNF